MKRSVVASWIVVVAFSGACADAEHSRVNSDAGTTAHDAFGSPTVSISGVVTEFRWLPQPATPVPGVRVCQDEPRRCTETSEAGLYVLDGLSPEREALFTYEKPGYLTVLVSIVTPQFTGAQGTVALTPDDGNGNASFSAVRQAAGLPALEDGVGLGSISFSALTSTGVYLDETVHVRLKPDTGIPALYALTSDFSLSTEIPAGETAGFGIFANVPPGEYELEYTMDDGECIRISNGISGWPAKDGRANVTRVTARAQTTTYFTAQACVGNDEPAPTD